MATLAGIFDRMALTRGMEQANSPMRPTGDDPYRIRPIANEDIFFFSKTIDNSRVVRQADPREGRDCAFMIGASLAGAVALVALMLPTLYGSFAGYKVETLRQERARLVNERSALDLAEARILNPQRLQELAKEQSFIDPNPQKIVYLDPSHDGTVAKRITPAAVEQDQ
jgi:hypothetical protein